MKKKVKQEISNFDIKRFAKALVALNDDYHKRKNQNLLSVFIKLANEVINEFEDTVIEEIGYLPGILKDELKRQYLITINKAKDEVKI